AVLEAAAARGVSPPAAEGFASTTGQGVRGRVEGRDAVLGTAGFAGAAGAPALVDWAAAQEAQGRTAVFLAADGAPLGALALEDPVREGAAEALAALRAEGLRLIMATGDARATAEATAARLGLTEVHARLTPEGKHDLVQALRAEGGAVAMAGDGVNDAPALAAADAGIAMGAGADAALESAGVTLIGGDLRTLLRARRLATATLRNLRLNIVFAFAYNGLGVPVAAGVLYPMFGLLLSPMIAAAAMSLSSVSVIANALRLRGVRLDRATSRAGAA
ncbi:MAG: HAD-IC family P-type ATPase, partial [Pseudomonadota bacterium]